jgi:hypothetical protein
MPQWTVNHPIPSALYPRFIRIQDSLPWKIQNRAREFLPARMASQAHTRPVLATTIRSSPYSSERIPPIREGSTTRIRRSKIPVSSAADQLPLCNDQIYAGPPTVPSVSETTPHLPLIIADCPLLPSRRVPGPSAGSALPGTMCSQGHKTSLETMSLLSTLHT